MTYTMNCSCDYVTLWHMRYYISCSMRRQYKYWTPFLVPIFFLTFPSI